MRRRESQQNNSFESHDSLYSLEALISYILSSREYCIETTSQRIEGFSSKNLGNGNFQLIFHIKNLRDPFAIRTSLSEVTTRVTEISGNRDTFRLEIKYGVNNSIVLIPTPAQTLQLESQIGLLDPQVTELSDIFQTFIDMGQLDQQKLNHVLDSIHQILCNTDLDLEKILWGDAARLLETLDECSESDNKTKLDFSSLRDRLNGSISGQSNRVFPSLSVKKIKESMTSEHHEYVDNYIKKLTTLVAKYRILLELLSNKLPDTGNMDTTQIVTRIKFIYYVISYFYKKDVELSESGPVYLSLIKAKTVIPTVFYQMIIVEHLRTLLQLIITDRLYDQSEGSVSTYYNNHNYILELYKTLLGRTTKSK